VAPAPPSVVAVRPRRRADQFDVVQVTLEMLASYASGLSRFLVVT
jgi:hypothetical protein